MLHDAHVRGEAGMPRYVAHGIPQVQDDVGEARSQVHGPVAGVHGRIVHVHDDDGIPQLHGRHEMPNGNSLRSGAHAHVQDVLSMRGQDHLSDHEMHANDANVHA